MFVISLSQGPHLVVTIEVMGDSIEGNTDFNVESIGTNGEDGEGTKQEEKNVVGETCKEKTQVRKPMLGMVFNDTKKLQIFYANYARDKGFGVTTRSSNMGEDGKLKYITLAYARSGKTKSTARNSLKPQPSTKMPCKAKVNASIWPDEKFRLITVVLEHNHGLSPAKARYYKSNKKMSSNVKRRFELND